jgi:D-aminoacyl-tRNA deacylase
MYQKYLIIASKLDKAGINITTQLSQFRENPLLSSMKEKPSFDFYLVDKEIIYTENLDIEKINRYDFIIFASKHRSEKNERTLSIHAPGNWRSTMPQLGGEAGKVCPTSALFQKQMFEKLNENAEKYHLRDYKVTLECTHHGPLINKPCLFIESGSTENEWTDRKAGFVIATTIRDVISEFKENPYNEIAIGIGGPHYCPNFSKIQLNSNFAISHIIPGYVLPISEEMVKEAIQKTEEEINFVLLDWKGLANAEERQRILQILDKNYISYKKTSEVKK